MEPRNEAQDTNDTIAQPIEGRVHDDSDESSDDLSVGRAAFGFRRLPLKTLYLGIEFFTENEEMFDEAMERLDMDGPDVGLKAALAFFCNGKIRRRPEHEQGRRPKRSPAPIRAGSFDNPLFFHPNGCSRDGLCGVNKRAPSGVTYISSSSLTPNSPGI